MSLFVENPLAIGIVGGLATTLAMVFFLARQTGGSLAALAGVVAVTLLLLVIERVIQTDREQVASAVDTVYAAVETNDVAAVLASIDSAAAIVRSDAQVLMPQIQASQAHTMGTVEIEVNAAANPPTAVSRSKAFLDGVHGSSGMRVAYFNQQVDLTWVKRGDRWLLDGYTPYFDGKPIDAVGSAQGNRPVR